MNTTRTVTLLTTLLLTGCVTGYVDPSGPDTATLTIHNTNKTYDAGIHAFKVADDCSGGRLRIADTPRLTQGQSVSLKVKANEPFSFFVQYNLPLGVFKEGNCFMPATFTPRAGMRYIARADFLGKSCSLSVTSVTPAGEAKEPTFRMRNFRVSMTDTGASCQ